MTGHTIILGSSRDPNGVRDTKLSKPCGHCGAPFYRDKRCTWAHWGRAKFCSRACAGAGVAREKIARRPSREVAFSKWFVKGDGCWEWNGATNSGGYGLFSYAGHSAYASRVALELDGRPPSPEQYACHHCDNPSCVRPDHLYPGSPSENVQDMIARGRGKWASRSSTKLNAAKVRLIRASDKTHEAIAEQFGVSRANISLIKERRTWRNIL